MKRRLQEQGIPDAFCGSCTEKTTRSYVESILFHVSIAPELEVTIFTSQHENGRVLELPKLVNSLPATEISKFAAFQEFEKEKRHMNEHHKRGQVSEVS